MALGDKPYNKHGICGYEAEAIFDEKTGKHTFRTVHTPSSDTRRAVACVPPELPGVVIFVHGVNSEGEWYQQGEEGVIKGLNERLHLSGKGNAELVPNKFPEKNSGNDHDKGKSPRIDPKVVQRSPVIHFYWGYRAKDGEDKKYKVPLKNRSGSSGWAKDYDKQRAGGSMLYWNGGPFQNGTNNLPLLWSKQGFKKRVAGVVNVQALNPEVDRQLQDAPPREYYAHAANRLAKLIDKIRTQYPEDTVSVISHSQGTMIAMAAMFLVKTRVPDCLMLCNAPYAMEHKTTDGLQFGGNTATDRARRDTFVNMLKLFQRDKRPLSGERLNTLRVGGNADCSKSWRPTDEGERDNHGRVYVYFNPHDRVMGSTALQSIGWQGVPKELLDQFQGTLYQRVMLRGREVGGDPREQPIWPDDGKPFWDGMRTTNGLPMDLWTTPPKDKKVPINAERVPNPITAQEMAEFDEHRNGKKWGDEDDFHFFRDIYEREAWVKDGEDDNGNAKYRVETQQELEARIGVYVPEPTDHSTLPSDPKFLSRVVAYDLPIGICNSFEDTDFWKALRKDADWLQSDWYFISGELDVPPLPAGIVTETFDDLRKQEQALNDLKRAQRTQVAEAHWGTERRRLVV